LVAEIKQVPVAAGVKTAETSVQVVVPAAYEKLTEPLPLPPLVVSVSGVPNDPEVDEIDNADWLALLKVKVSALLVAAL
jgi:hypothetical protein